MQRGFLNYKIFPHIGHIQINALTSHDIQKMINAVLEERSCSAVKKVHYFLIIIISLFLHPPAINRNNIFWNT